MAPNLPNEIPVNGIRDPNYTENPEMEDKPQWEANIVQFDKTGVLLWHPTRSIYEFIKNDVMSYTLNHPQYPKFIWRPKVVDVGCGAGVGSNILSQEADFVWGIDKNAKSVKFAQEAFTRVRNGIYYSSQVSFDIYDIMAETRATMKFDEIVCVEIIEHISDTHTFLTNLIKKFNKTKNEPSQYYISTPNRNHPQIQKDRPKNIYHVKEFSSGELVVMLSNYFTNIELFTAAGIPIPKEEYETTTHTPLLAKCTGVKI